MLGLVGKGITFDTGGICIKPADGMEKMKYDMAGGATMIGAMRAIALLKPNVRVIGIVCATENMPSGKAQKPGDVQIAMCGKSIEIINTDAEGRLVLADGLHYARSWAPPTCIDAATLTGACVVALGYVNAGVFCNDDNSSSSSPALKPPAKKCGACRSMPNTRTIKSDIADIKNTGGRWGGAISAAMFLKEFVEDTPWIHLDIAGTAWIEDANPGLPKARPERQCARWWNLSANWERDPDLSSQVIAASRGTCISEGGPKFACRLQMCELRSRHNLLMHNSRCVDASMLPPN